MNENTKIVPFLLPLLSFCDCALAVGITDSPRNQRENVWFGLLFSTVQLGMVFTVHQFKVWLRMESYWQSLALALYR